MDTRNLVHRGEWADSHRSQCGCLTKPRLVGSEGLGGSFYCVVQKSGQWFLFFGWGFLHESKLVNVGKGEHINSSNEG